MELRAIRDKSVWNKALEGVQEKTFLHSWEWGNFQNEMEEKIWRFGIYNESHLLAVCLVVKVRAKRGDFLFIPHGPVIVESLKEGGQKQKKGRPLLQTKGRPLLQTKAEIIKVVLEKLKKIAKKEKAKFIRIAPIWERNQENTEAFRELGFREAPLHIHPEITWQLDVTPSEEELLKGMRKNTRNLIRKAQREGVKIVKSTEENALSSFYELYMETVNRHQFAPFSWEYLKKELETFLPDKVLVLIGEYKGKPLASAMVVYWQGRGFYHQGASVSSKLPVSYLLQWEAIRELKKREGKIYNFWGIAPEEDSNHPWAGLTWFKKGFGGEKREYVRTQDMPLSLAYWGNWAVERFRAYKRFGQ